MTATDILLDNGYDEVVVFSDKDYTDALIGVTTDNIAVYDYQKMIDWLVKEEGWTEEQAGEWIDFNTLRSYPPGGKGMPIIMYSLYD